MVWSNCSPNVCARLLITHYAHPYEIDIQRHRFVIVFSVPDLALVVKTFYIKSVPVPVLIHIDDPNTISQTDYAVQFPAIDIAPIPQTNLTDKEGTLKIALFQEIIESMTASKVHEAPQRPVNRQIGAADQVDGSPNAR